MDDKTQKEDLSSGHNLLEHVINLTGIPGKTLRRELQAILEKKNVDLNNLTLDQLREAVASYVREIMSAALDKSPPEKREN